jgi:hypothetical protein
MSIFFGRDLAQDMPLNEYELRVLGALVEKQIATPDYYPMTLNALMNACNQKNHRDPVVAYDEQTVTRALDSLREKKLAYTFHGSDARVPKYGHVFPKAYDLSAGEVALMVVLMLRGPQTPGELRSRSQHLHQFENLPEVESLLQGMATRAEPLVLKLPRQAGSRESRYAHLIDGEINVEELEQTLAIEAPARSSRGESERIQKLEEQVAALQREVQEMKSQFADFKKQFE